MHPAPCTRPQALDALGRPHPLLSHPPPRTGSTCHGSPFCLTTAPPRSQAVDLRRRARGATAGGRGAARRLPARRERRAVRVPPLPRRLHRALQAGGALDLGAAPRRRQGPGGVDGDGRRIGRPLLLLLRHQGAPRQPNAAPRPHTCSGYTLCAYITAALTEARAPDAASDPQTLPFTLWLHSPRRASSRCPRSRSKSRSGCRSASPPTRRRLPRAAA